MFHVDKRRLPRVIRAFVGVNEVAVWHFLRKKKNTFLITWPLDKDCQNRNDENRAALVQLRKAKFKKNPNVLQRIIFPDK